MKKLPPNDFLHAIFRYDKENGLLYRTVKTANNARLGRPVGTLNMGYLVVRVRSENWLVHRIIWKMHYGTEPKEIDHINGNRSDNRIENLRSVDRTQNTRNMAERKDNKSGCTGVYWAKREKSWVASIYVDGRFKGLGYYKNKADAISARKEAERKYKYHENHGRK